jgi:hypothetical protein
MTFWNQGEGWVGERERERSNIVAPSNIGKKEKE